MRRHHLTKLTTAAAIVALSFTMTAGSALAAKVTPTVTWKVTSLAPSSKTTLTSIVSTNSTGKKTWRASGSCSITANSTRVTTTASGTCKLTLTVSATTKFNAITRTRNFTIVKVAPSTTTTSTTAVASTLSWSTASGCPSNYLFPNVNSLVGAGGSYAKASVSVSCSGTSLTMKSNGMISYGFVSKTPNGLKAQDYTWNITTAPKVASATTSIENKLGTVGFTVSGIPIFGPMEGPVPPQEAFGDPVYNNLLDDCKGHTGYMGDYHYHAILATAACSLNETLIGFALDGFPIYSNPNNTYKSGYTMTGNPRSNAWKAYTWSKGDANTLDACNGTTVNGNYRYYTTGTFPYIIGCYTGSPAQVTGAAARPMVMSASVRENSVFAATSNELYCELS